MKFLIAILGLLVVLDWLTLQVTARSKYATGRWPS